MNCRDAKLDSTIMLDKIDYTPRHPHARMHARLRARAHTHTHIMLDKMDQKAEAAALS